MYKLILEAKMERKLEVFEMQYLRGILGVTIQNNKNKEMNWDRQMHQQEMSSVYWTYYYVN